jgi:hypothetical protein
MESPCRPTHWPQLVSRSVKQLLVFTSTVIPGISLLEINHEDFYSLLDMYKYRNGASSSTRDGSVFVGAMFVAPQTPHEYIHAVTEFRSLWTLCSFCHCTILSNTTYRGFLSLQACAAVFQHLFNYSEMPVSQLNGCRPDHLQV